MGVHKNEDVIGYQIGEEVVCCDCASKEEADNVEESGLMLEFEVANNDDLIFCDRCKKRIW